MKDPYTVLGVSPNASDDEIKSAYRKLAKQYHPDNFAGSDLSGKAEEKMKEINAAYQEIQDIRSGKKASGSSYGGSGGFGGFGGYGGYGGYGGSYSAESDPEYAQIYEFIRTNRIAEAETLLDRIEFANRGAKWHFYMGHVAYRKGHLSTARSEFAEACRLDPSNPVYRNAYDSMNRGSQSSPYGNAFGSGMSCCEGLMCLNCICQCMRCCG